MLNCFLTSHACKKYLFHIYIWKIKFLPTLLEGSKVKHKLNIHQCFYVESSVLRAWWKQPGQLSVQGSICRKLCKGTAKWFIITKLRKFLWFMQFMFRKIWIFMSILNKKVSLDSLKIDGPHVEICSYSIQMSKLNQIKAKTKWEKKTHTN